MMFFKSKEVKPAATPAAAEPPLASPRGQPTLLHHASHGALVNELVRKRGPAALTSSGPTASAATSSSSSSPSAAPTNVGPVSPRRLSASTPSLPSCPPSPPTPHLPHSPPTSPRSAPTSVPTASSQLSLSSSSLSSTSGAMGTGMHRPPPLAPRRVGPPPIPSSPKPALVVTRTPPQGTSPASSPHSSSYSSPSPSSSSPSSTSPSSSSYACASPLANSPSAAAGLPPSSSFSFPSSSATGSSGSVTVSTGMARPLQGAYPPPPPPPRKPLQATPTMVVVPGLLHSSSESETCGPPPAGSETNHGPPSIPKIPPGLGSSASFPSPASPSFERRRSNTVDTAQVRKESTLSSPNPPIAASPTSSPSHSPGSTPSSPRGAYPLPSLAERNVGEKAREIQQQLQFHQQHPHPHLHQQQQHKEKEKDNKLLKRTMSEKNVPQSMVTVNNPLMSLVSPRGGKNPGTPASMSGSQEKALRPRKGTDIAGMAIRRMDERKAGAAADADAAEHKVPPIVPRRKLTDEDGDDPLANLLSINRLCGPAAASAVASAAGAQPPSAPLSPRELRQMVVNELIQTERSYCRDLHLIVEVWMKPLRVQGLFAAEDVGIVFSNVEQLRMLNEELLTSLQGVEDRPASEQDVGLRFARFVDFLKLYFAYCANQASAIERLQELKKSKPQLQQVLEEIKNKPECNLLDLESYLIKPLQRVTKYPLLLKEILKYTEESHPDYAALDKCYTRIAEVVLEINEKKRQSENLVKLIYLQNNFITNAGEEPLKLISPHRRLMAHGTFKRVFLGTKAPVKVKNGHLFLFNDMLLVASEEGTMFKKAKKFANRSGPIAITNVLLWSGNDAEGLIFCIVRMDDSSGQITLQASSPEEKFEWITRINDCIVTLPNSGLRGGASREPADGVEKFSRAAK